VEGRGPEIVLEPRRYALLVAPPDALLGSPEAGRYASLCLNGAGSRVLHCLPRRSPRLSVRRCMIVYRLLTSHREADATIVNSEYDNGVLSALDAGDRDVIFAVVRSLRELVLTSTVLLRAERSNRGVRSLFTTADQGVLHVEERRPAPSGRAGRPRKPGAARPGGSGMDRVFLSPRMSAPDVAERGRRLDRTVRDRDRAVLERLPGAARTQDRATFYAFAAPLEAAVISVLGICGCQRGGRGVPVAGRHPHPCPGFSSSGVASSRRADRPERAVPGSQDRRWACDMPVCVGGGSLSGPACLNPLRRSSLTG